MKRGFKIVSSKKDQDIHLPQRQTTRAAGYDFEASEDFVLPSINYGLRDYRIKKGERIGQGIFMPYLTADSEEQPTAKRTGGFGSTKE